MAVLPVKCSKCKNTVNVDPEKHGLKCPSCGTWVNTAMALQKQHPKWAELLAQEKKLNEEANRLSEYEGTYESTALKTKRFLIRYMYVIIMLTVDIVCFIIRIAVYGFTAPSSALEVLLIITMLILSFAAYLLPMIMQQAKERTEETNGKNYAREARPKLNAKMIALQKEKEEYLKEHGQINASQ
jgi:Cholesterol-capturing domain.